MSEPQTISSSVRVETIPSFNDPCGSYPKAEFSNIESPKLECSETKSPKAESPNALHLAIFYSRRFCVRRFCLRRFYVRMRPRSMRLLRRVSANFDYRDSDFLPFHIYIVARTYVIPIFVIFSICITNWHQKSFIF